MGDGQHIKSTDGLHLPAISWFFRFAKWMELLAQVIGDGVIEIPNHQESELEKCAGWNK